MRARNGIALVLGTVLALGASYAAYQLATYSWNQVVAYRGPDAKGQVDETPPPLRTDLLKTKRVVYVIVDGLRDDVSRKMPKLEQLRKGGFSAVVRTSQPSLSFPNWTNLLAGAPQRISGVTTNWFEGRVPVETLIDVALRTNRGVVVSAPKDFEMLYGVGRTGHSFLRDWTEGTYMSGEIVDHAIQLTRDSTATPVIVHLPDIDEAGNAHGGSSAPYLAMARTVDAGLGRRVGALQRVPRTCRAVPAPVPARASRRPRLSGRAIPGRSWWGRGSRCGESPGRRSRARSRRGCQQQPAHRSIW